MHQRKYFTLNFFINEIFSVEKFLNYGNYYLLQVTYDTFWYITEQSPIWYDKFTVHFQWESH